MARSKNPHLSVNSEVESRIKASAAFKHLVRCTGYVGRAAPGRVRLYLSLKNLSQYVEFEERAIVRTHKAGDRVMVWLNPATRVRAVYVRTLPARTLTRVVAANRRLKRWLVANRRGAQRAGGTVP
jgi:hypothetical protein